MLRGNIQGFSSVILLGLFFLSVATIFGLFSIIDNDCKRFQAARARREAMHEVMPAPRATLKDLEDSLQ
jgi:hypothetical protein